MVGRESDADTCIAGVQRVQLPLVGPARDSPVKASLTNADIEELMIQADAEGILDQ